MHILLINSNGIEDAAFGGAKGNRRIYELLKSQGEVDVLSIQKKSDIASLRSLLQGYFPPAGRGDLIQIGKMLTAKQYDLVFFDGSYFGKLMQYVRSRGVKTICFYNNCEYDYIEVRFGAGASLKKSIYKKTVAREERAAARSADVNVALNVRDGERIRELYDVPMPEILPLSLVDVYEHRVPQKGEKKCLLFGPLAQANEEAYGWFAENVSPYLHCCTKVAGKGFEVHQRDWSSDKVEVLGYVDDIAQLYADAACVVIPLLSGGGMKIKTAEALMFGKHIFGTDEAFVGYELEYEKVGGKCNSAQEFIEKINAFLEQDTGGFYAYSRQIYEEKYSQQAVEGILASITAKVL